MPQHPALPPAGVARTSVSGVSAPASGSPPCRRRTNVRVRHLSPSIRLSPLPAAHERPRPASQRRPISSCRRLGGVGGGRPVQMRIPPHADTDPHPASPDGEEPEADAPQRQLPASGSPPCRHHTNVRVRRLSAGPYLLVAGWGELEGGIPCRLISRSFTHRAARLPESPGLLQSMYILRDDTWKGVP